jgi:hypothetical protein
MLRCTSLNSQGVAGFEYGMSDEICSTLADQSVPKAYRLIRKRGDKPFLL